MNLTSKKAIKLLLATLLISQVLTQDNGASASSTVNEDEDSVSASASSSAFANAGGSSGDDEAVGNLDDELPPPSTSPPPSNNEGGSGDGSAGSGTTDLEEDIQEQIDDIQAFINGESFNITLPTTFPSNPSNNDTSGVPPLTGEGSGEEELPEEDPEELPEEEPEGEQPPITDIEPVCGVWQDLSYDYRQNGTDWGCECANQTYQQSPIDVPLLATFAPVFFNIDTTVSFANVRRWWIDDAKNFVTVNYKSDGYLRVDGVFSDYSEISKVFKPTGQMFFHTPAEHTFNGAEAYDVELEIGMHSIFGEQAFVSVFFDYEDGGRTANPFLTQFKLGGNSTLGQENMSFEDLGLTDFIKDLSDESLWYYEGSTTTPPCSSGVHWFLFNDPQPISRAQLSTLQEKFSNNSRAVQEVKNASDVYWLGEFATDTKGCSACEQWWL